jgi:hypothetical protein
MKSAIVGIISLLLGVVGVALAQSQRIAGGRSTLTWEIEPGETRVGAASITDAGTGGGDARAVQQVRVCVAGTSKCRDREIVCTSATTATLDGVAITPPLPTALAAFCDAMFAPAPNFLSR